MSIANLFTENAKTWQDLKVNSILVDEPITKSFQLYENVNWANGVTVSTQSGRILATGSLPQLTPLEVVQMDVTCALVNSNSIIILSPNFYQIVPADYARCNLGILSIIDGGFTVYLANPDDQVTITPQQELSFDYVIINTNLVT